MAATSKELERYEALAKAPAMKTASPGPVTEMVVQGNTAVPTKSLGAQVAEPPRRPILWCRHRPRMSCSLYRWVLPTLPGEKDSRNGCLVSPIK